MHLCRKCTENVLSLNCSSCLGNFCLTCYKTHFPFYIGFRYKTLECSICEMQLCFKSPYKSHFKSHFKSRCNIELYCRKCLLKLMCNRHSSIIPKDIIKDILNFI